MNNKPTGSKEPSRFKSLRDTQPEPTTWKALYEEITNGTHATATAHYRKHLATLSAAETAVDPARMRQWKLIKTNLKSAQPAFVPSVILEDGRTTAHIKGFTGFIMVDLDGIPAEQLGKILARVKADTHSFLVYITLSGCGIRIISRTEGKVDKHNFRLVWQSVNDYYADLCGVKTDSQCKNTTRMSVICHDPEALFRPEATPFEVSHIKPAPKKRRQTATAEQAYSVISEKLEQEGIAYAPGNHNNYISRCLYLMNRYGVAREEAEGFALRTFTEYPETQITSIVRSCYALTAEFATMALPRPAKRKDDGTNRPRRATLEEMEAFIEKHMEIRINTITHQIETRAAAPQPDSENNTGDETTYRPNTPWERLTDLTENSLWCAMQRAGMNVSLTDLHTLLTSDYVKQYNPFLQYLDSLPSWDGQTDHIGRFAAMVHVKNAPGKSRNTPEENGMKPSHFSFPHIFKRWLVSMIASALDDKVVNQVILVLIGRQGSYKTSFMEHILPPELSEYYTTKSNSSRMTKDDMFTMTEKLIINLEEIDTMSASDLNQLKAMVTQRYVDERPPYGRNKVHLPHVASFVATGNNRQFLTDDTGNRRWLPFEIESIDSPWQADIPYEGIYSQAYALYRDNSFRFWFTDDEVHRLSRHVQQFEVPRPEYELILTYFRRPTDLERGTYITCSQLINRLGTTSLRLSLQKVGRALRELGFQQVKTANANYWVVVERTADEVRHLLPEAAEHTPTPPE